MALDHEKIKEQARKLLDNFAAALGDIETKDSSIELEKDRRDETQATGPSPDFKKRILGNAKNKDSDCIIAEKGSWI